MTNNEFDSQFDILYNNIASNAAPSVTPYEKSVFLTQAQKDIILELYNGRGVTGLFFESTEEARKYLSNLVKTYEITVSGDTDVITLPDKLWFTTYEECILDDDSLECLNSKTALVQPLTLDNKYKILDNPFRGPSERRVLREDINGGIKLHSKYKISLYRMTYLENPNPIILEDLSSYGLSVEGINTESETNVNPILHLAILDRAVQLAKQAYLK